MTFCELLLSWGWGVGTCFRDMNMYSIWQLLLRCSSPLSVCISLSYRPCSLLLYKQNNQLDEWQVIPNLKIDPASAMSIQHRSDDIGTGPTSGCCCFKVQSRSPHFPSYLEHFPNLYIFCKCWFLELSELLLTLVQASGHRFGKYNWRCNDRKQSTCCLWQ